MIDTSEIPLLRSLAPWDSVQWLRTEDGLVFFEIRREESVEYAAACFFVRKEEAEVWKACQDMLSEAVRMAAGWVQGLFGFHMIAMELEQGIQNFRLGDLGQLLTNHARQMAVGESRLIRYGGLWGVFKKRVPESYGKIEFKMCVKIYRQEAERLDLYLGALARGAAQVLPPASAVSLIACDLSSQRVYQAAEVSQQEKLQSLYQKLEKNEEGSIRISKLIYRHEREELNLWAKHVPQ